MKYMFSLFSEERSMEDLSPEQLKAGMASWEAFGIDAQEAGVLVAGDGLQDSSTATTLRADASGERVVTDGPFAETKEQLAGFYLLDCENLDAALEWAHKIPFPHGAIEVRPVLDYEAIGSYDTLQSREASRTA
jgi:hypothetical protein